MVELNEASRRAAALLTGPRGREATVAVARLVEPQLVMPHEMTDETGRALLIEQLAGLDLRRIAALDDPLELVHALGTSVDSARYWQEPFEHDATLADPEAAAQLDPIARAVSLAPAAQWWWSPVDLTRQSMVRWSDQTGAPTETPPLLGAASRLERWRADAVDDEDRAAAERPEDPAAAYSGYWWSTPALADLVTTSRQLGRLPAVQLDLVEDSMGWERALVTRVEPEAGARVFEIAEASDWIDLVARYPLDVDRSRRHDWYRTTGSTGPWQIPDWLAVSRDHDAVHLTVAGYLAAAGRALPTERGWTVLAGFDPDLTYWLTDVVRSIATPESWIRKTSEEGDHEWVRETPL